ncbi:hypothetical protein MMC30_004789 [Trapelia coarctata]|nr:hypothetical protein [Trapelia coarctata]
MAADIAVDCSPTPKSALDSTFPVLLPEEPALFLSDFDFGKHINTFLSKWCSSTHLTGTEDALAKVDLAGPAAVETSSTPDPSQKLSFMDALASATATSKPIVARLLDNKMYTENMGVTNSSTNSSLLDLFSELEKTVTGERLQELLQAAWKEDPLATLKIVWNARSIHLGKGEQDSFYRCLGWIKNEHPKTVLANLPWLVRPIIEKKAKKEDDEAAVMVEMEEPSAGEEYAVLNGVSHGYWKDLLNMLVLAAKKSFNVLAEPSDVLRAKNNQPEFFPGVSSLDSKEYNARHKEAAKDRKHELEKLRHENAVKMLQENPFYRALHLTVTKIFETQLRKDMELLKSGKREDLGKISLAAKWAPSSEGFHDKHTFIVSSIAEALYPKSFFAEIEESREMYLRRARESLRRLTLAPLRKALDVVERNICAETFEKINYSKVPSVAMDNYKDLFVRKDLDHFEKYIDKVAAGKSRISGAVLLPATLVHQVRQDEVSYRRATTDKKAEAKRLLDQKIAQIQGKALDGQWATLVKRIKDNGKMSSSIAVCDVSGSMSWPELSDKTVPMDTAIGLSLLLAEITEPPFGGHFITFSANPKVLAVGGPNDKRSFAQKVGHIMRSEWGMNTDFSAVFERLILPMAIEHKLKQEDMVEQVFVFSDMQFDVALAPTGSEFETDFERIKRKYAEAGYKPPKLIFWNLAGGGGRGAPKPVTKETENTMLVSGYSQGMMKMFLENGQFDGEVEEEDIVDEEMKDGSEDMALSSGEEPEETFVEVKTKKRKVDPMAGLRKAIGHKAYDMLKVVD